MAIKLFVSLIIITFIGSGLYYLKDSEPLDNPVEEIADQRTEVISSPEKSPSLESKAPKETEFMEEDQFSEEEINLMEQDAMADLTEQERWIVDRVNIEAIPKELKEELKGYEEDIVSIEKDYEPQIFSLVEKINMDASLSKERREVLEKKIETLRNSKEKKLMHLMGADLYNQYISQQVDKLDSEIQIDN